VGRGGGGKELDGKCGAAAAKAEAIGGYVMCGITSVSVCERKGGGG